jgi:hypothetical protein
MDLGDLLILLLFLLPFLSRLFGKQDKPTPQRQRPLPTPDGRERAPRPDLEDPLGEALRQIREALGETETEPERPQRQTVERPLEAPAEFREVGEFEHDEHGFGRSNPLSEEVFENRPAYREMRGTDRLDQMATDRIKQKPLKSVDLTTPLEVDRTVGTEATETTADALRDPKRAREAFIMKEVLGPPRSQQRLR